MSFSVPIDLSLIVSTRDRSTDVLRFLESLQASVVNPGRSWELILVNNGSRDDTETVARRFAAGARFPCQVISEMRPGKSAALNAAMKLARGRIFAFTDDDIIVTPNWLDSIVEHLDRTTGIDCVGGMVQLYNAADAPISVRLSTRAQTIGLGEFAANNIPVGGNNMAIRASACAEIGGFDEVLGPGRRIAAAEDLDYLYRLLRSGRKLAYFPDIMVFHNHGRRTQQQVERTRSAYLIGRGAFYAKYIRAGDRTVLRWAWWECSSLLGWNWLKAPFSTQSRESLSFLRSLIRGALLYLREMLRSRASRTA